MAQQAALKEDQGLKHQLKLVMQQLSCVEELALAGCWDATAQDSGSWWLYKAGVYLGSQDAENVAFHGGLVLLQHL